VAHDRGAQGGRYALHLQQHGAIHVAHRLRIRGDTNVGSESG
jgi:hypothetical protein